MEDAEREKLEQLSAQIEAVIRAIVQLNSSIMDLNKTSQIHNEIIRQISANPSLDRLIVEAMRMRNGPLEVKANGNGSSYSSS